MCQTDRVGNLRFRRPKWPLPYVGEHNATAYGPSCSQLEPALVPPAGLPAVTLEVLESVGTSPALSKSEDCEESLCMHTVTNPDGCCRFDDQCHHTCQCHMRFKISGCSGVYLPRECRHLLITTHVTVVFWR